MRRLLFPLAFIGLMVGCQTPPRQEVPTPLPPDAVERVWRADLKLEDAKVRSLHVVQDLLFVYTTDNTSCVLDRESGRVLAIDRITARSVDELFPPIVLKDWIVYPTGVTIEIYDRKTHRKLASALLPFGVRAAGVGEGDLVFLPSDYTNGGRISAVSANPADHVYEQPPIWERMTFGGITSRPAIFQGMIYVASRDSRVYGLRLADQAAIWAGLRSTWAGFETGGQILADIAVDSQGVYVASTDTVLYALDPMTGRIRWQYYAGVPLEEDSDVYSVGDSVYLYVPGKGIVALDKAGEGRVRTPRWTVSDARRFLGADERYVYVLMKDNTAAAVGKGAAAEGGGEVKIRGVRKDMAAFATNVVDGTLYAATAKGVVYAARPVRKAGAFGEQVRGDAPQPVYAGRFRP